MPKRHKNKKAAAKASSAQASDSASSAQVAEDKYKQGITTPYPLTAIKLLREATELGHVQASLELGQRLEAQGEDQQQTRRLYRFAAEQGNAEGQYLLGLLLSGEKAPGGPNPAESARLFGLASAQGHGKALLRLGIFHEQGLGGLKRDAGLAARRYREAANKGEAEAFRRLGGLYDEGTGVVRDQGEALRLYWKAKELGDVEVEDRIHKLTKRLRTCSFCGRQGRNLKKCAGCPRGARARYCDVYCQKAHWQEHKTTCAAKSQPGATPEGSEGSEVEPSSSAGPT